MAFFEACIESPLEKPTAAIAAGGYIPASVPCRTAVFVNQVFQGGEQCQSQMLLLIRSYAD